MDGASRCAALVNGRGSSQAQNQISLCSRVAGRRVASSSDEVDAVGAFASVVVISSAVVSYEPFFDEGLKCAMNLGRNNGITLRVDPLAGNDADAMVSGFNRLLNESDCLVFDLLSGNGVVSVKIQNALRLIERFVSIR